MKIFSSTYGNLHVSVYPGSLTESFFVAIYEISVFLYTRAFFQEFFTLFKHLNIGLYEENALFSVFVECKFILSLD